MTANTTSQPNAVLEYLDPNAVDIGKNVRDDATEGPEYAELLAVVKEVGILVPLTAVRAGDGTVTIREGQRRTLVARELGLTEIPVLVREDTAADDKARTQQRVKEQLITNDYRKDISKRQRANAIQELLVSGLTPAKVAKSLAMPKKVIEAAAAAAKSEVALEALDTCQLTIEQAAQLVEFENNPDAAAELMATPNPTEFDRKVIELRQKAIETAARAEASIPYQEKGFSILDSSPRWPHELSRQKAMNLVDRDGNGADEKEITHPEHWAVWLDEVEVYLDSRSGEVVEERKVDWSLDADDHDATPEEGLMHPRYIEEGTVWDPTYVCIDLVAAGLMSWSDYNRQRSEKAGPTDAQDAAAREEAAKRKKRMVVKLNKLGQAAEQVRRAWVKDKLLSRKTPPKGAAIFIAGQLAAHSHLLTSNGSGQLTRELLGLADNAPIASAVTELPPTGDPRSIVILLGLVLGALEANTPKDAWRTKGVYSKNYLTFLVANGYDLADVEKVITGAMTDEALYDQIDSAAIDVDGVEKVA